jgi:ArsR family transcriptional regulator
MEELFKALGEHNRLRILALLRNGEMCVCEIEDCINLSQSNLSRHLTVLKKCGILQSYKKAQWVYYTISDSFIESNKELWAYLSKKFADSSEYAANCENYHKCKAKNLCKL